MSAEQKNINELHERLSLSDKLDHEARERLAQGKDALSISRLEEILGHERVHTEGMDDTFRAVGWPEQRDQTNLVYGDTFMGKEADAWFRDVVLYMGRVPGGFRLGNFLHMFQQPPTYEPETVHEMTMNNPVGAIYATKPALLRLFALDEFLVKDVMEIVQNKSKGEDWIEYLRRFDVANRDNTLSNVALTIIRQAYMTMTRLVSEDDRTTQYKILQYGKPEEAGPITNIGNYLTE